MVKFEKKFSLVGTTLTTEIYTVCPCCGERKLWAAFTRELTSREQATVETRRKRVREMLKELGW